MSRIPDYVATSARSDSLAELLQAWNKEVRRVFDLTKTEYAPYAFKEETNVGALATAAARIGWAALPESYVARQAPDKPPSHGKVDLALWNHAGEKSLLEAKLTVRAAASLDDRLKVVVAEALKDVTQLAAANGPSARYATIFVIPRFPRRSAATTIEADNRRAIALCEALTPDFLAYTFPGCVERRSADRLDRNMCAAGVILFGFRLA